MLLGLEITPSCVVPKNFCVALMVALPSFPSSFNFAPSYLFKNCCHFLIALLVFEITPSFVVPKNCCHLLIVAFPLYPSTFNFVTTLLSPLPLIYLIGSTDTLFLFLTSKCKCEPVTFPVAPCRPIIVLVVTFCPFLTFILFKCA